METPNLDHEIERLNLLETTNDLSEYGKELIAEYKAIKQALSLHNVVGQSEQLHTEVFNLANKLAINGYGNEAVKMHRICNGMYKQNKLI